MIPEGAEVHSGKSKTLEDVGLYAEVVESGRYDAIRPPLRHGPQERRPARSASCCRPGHHAGQRRGGHLDGMLVAASATGSQLGAYAAGAGRLILVVGSQKIVPNLDEALRRIERSCSLSRTPRSCERLGVDTKLEEELLIYGEWTRAHDGRVRSRARGRRGRDADAS